MSNFYQDVIQKDLRFNSANRVNDLALLEPVTRAAVTALLADAEAAGTPLLVFETFRSNARQQLLFTQGATKLRQVGVHHYGLAVDLVKNINGEPSWKGDFSFLRALAIKNGLVWGGDWAEPNQPHTFHDCDHVQRCSIADQPRLFAGTWFPGDDYGVQWG
jgi:hypothetical protein